MLRDKGIEKSNMKTTWQTQESKELAIVIGGKDTITSIISFCQVFVVVMKALSL